MILHFIYVYRMWQVVEGKTGRTTPGKAVGFLFIPLFNFYWLFQAFYGWSRDYNRLIETEGPADAPRVPTGVFLPWCILAVVGAIPILNWIVTLPAWVLFAIMGYHMCKVITYFAGPA